MKAHKTRLLIDSLVSQMFNGGKRLSDINVLHAYISRSDKEIDELERLAEIGRATERLLDDEIEGYMVSNRTIEGSNRLIDESIDSVEQLLEWYEIAK